MENSEPPLAEACSVAVPAGEQISDRFAFRSFVENQLWFYKTAMKAESFAAQFRFARVLFLNDNTVELAVCPAARTGFPGNFRPLENPFSTISALFEGAASVLAISKSGVGNFYPNARGKQFDKADLLLEISEFPACMVRARLSPESKEFAVSRWNFSLVSKSGVSLVPATQLPCRDSALIASARKFSDQLRSMLEVSAVCRVKEAVFDFLRTPSRDGALTLTLLQVTGLQLTHRPRSARPRNFQDVAVLLLGGGLQRRCVGGHCSDEGAGTGQTKTTTTTTSAWLELPAHFRFPEDPRMKSSSLRVCQTCYDFYVPAAATGRRRTSLAPTLSSEDDLDSLDEEAMLLVRAVETAFDGDPVSDHPLDRMHALAEQLESDEPLNGNLCFNELDFQYASLRFCEEVAAADRALRVLVEQPQPAALLRDLEFHGQCAQPEQGAPKTQSLFLDLVRKSLSRSFKLNEESVKVCRDKMFLPPSVSWTRTGAAEAEQNSAQPATPTKEGVRFRKSVDLHEVGAWTRKVEKYLARKGKDPWQGKIFLLDTLKAERDSSAFKPGSQCYSLLIDIVFSSDQVISPRSCCATAGGAAGAPVDDELAHMVHAAVRKLPGDLKTALTDAHTRAALESVLESMPSRKSLVEGKRKAAILAEKVKPRQDWVSVAADSGTSKVRIFKRLAVKYKNSPF